MRSKRPTQFTPWSDADYFDYIHSKCNVIRSQDYKRRKAAGGAGVQP